MSINNNCDYDYNSDSENISTTLKKSRKNLNCEILLISRKRINGKINFLDYNKLKKVDCSQNKITELDGMIPETLLDLNCSNNKITTLDNLPSKLRILVCHHNLLTNLDYLPNSIYKLDCAFNEIVCLDNLPNCLEYLFCNNNYIKSLNNLPVCLKLLFCHNNEKNIELNNLPKLENIIKD